VRWSLGDQPLLVYNKTKCVHVHVHIQEAVWQSGWVMCGPDCPVNTRYKPWLGMPNAGRVPAELWLTFVTVQTAGIRCRQSYIINHHCLHKLAGIICHAPQTHPKNRVRTNSLNRKEHGSAKVGHLENGCWLKFQRWCVGALPAAAATTAGWRTQTEDCAVAFAGNRRSAVTANRRANKGDRTINRWRERL